MRLFYRGRTAEVYALDGGRVLKLYRDPGGRTEVEREAVNARAAYLAGVRTPGVLEIVTVDGRAGIVFELADGPTLLHAVARRPDDAVALGRTLAEVHADLHGRAAKDLPSQRAVLVDGITQAPELPDRVRHAAENALAVLPDGDALCHGDFHPLNVVMTAAGPTLLDWYKATRGNPAGDVARTLMLLRLNALPPSFGDEARRAIGAARPSFAAAYAERYAALRPSAWAEVPAAIVPVAVARLGREISANERRALLALVDAALVDGGRTLGVSSV